MAGTPRGRPDWERTSTRTAAAIANSVTTINPGAVTFGPFPVARWSKVMIGWRPAAIGAARMYYVSYAFTDVNGVAVTPNSLAVQQFNVLQGSPLWDQITVIGDQLTITVDCTTYDANSVGTLTLFPVDASAAIGDFYGDGVCATVFNAALGVGASNSAQLPMTARCRVQLVGFTGNAGVDFIVQAFFTVAASDVVMGYASDVNRNRYVTILGALPRRTCSLTVVNNSAGAAFVSAILSVVPT